MPGDTQESVVFRYDVEVRVGGEWDEVAVVGAHRADAKKNALHKLEEWGFEVDAVGRAVHPQEDRPGLEERVSRHRRAIGLEGSWLDEVIDAAVGIGKVALGIEAGKEEING